MQTGYVCTLVTTLFAATPIAAVAQPFQFEPLASSAACTIGGAGAFPSSSRSSCRRDFSKRSSRAKATAAPPTTGT